MAKQTFTTGQVLTAAQMTSLQQTAMGGGSPSTKTTSYVLTAADAGTVIQMNSASSTTITVNTALFATGDSVQIQNIGAGVCTITAGTATVSTAGSLALSQYEGGILYFNSTSASLFFDYNQPTTSAYLGASVFNSANQSIANNTVVALTFNSESFDTDSIHSTATNTSRLTIPTGKSGKYLISGGLYWAGNATGGRSTYVHKNGTRIFYAVQPVNQNTANIGLSWSYVVDATAGDYYEFFVFQDSGGALNILGGSDLTFLQISYLGA